MCIRNIYIYLSVGRWNVCNHRPGSLLHEVALRENLQKTVAFPITYIKVSCSISLEKKSGIGRIPLFAGNHNAAGFRNPRFFEKNT